MTESYEDPTSEDPSRPALVEGIARVVAVEGSVAWLEPEQSTSCGSCASAAMCGSDGVGSTAKRLAARRFALANDQALRVGERVIVGVNERALLKASGTAYALPLVTMFTAGGVAQSIAGSDGITMVSAVAGLSIGLLGARWGATWLTARGQLAPRFLRRLGPVDACQLR